MCHREIQKHVFFLGGKIGIGDVNGTATVTKQYGASSKYQNRIPHDPASSLLGVAIPKELEEDLEEIFVTCVHSSIVLNSQQVEAAETGRDGLMGAECAR